MLGTWKSHKSYQDFLCEKMLDFYLHHQTSLLQYSDVLNKLFILDLDELKAIIESCYSTTGRPAENQPEIFRSFILMSALKINSIPLWVKKLKADPILHNIIGVSVDQIPGVGTHYDFINRFWLNSDGIFSKSSKLKSFRRKPHKKFKKNEKAPPKHPAIVKRLVNKVLEGRLLSKRPERLFQDIFKHLAVLPSADIGLLGNTNKLHISGDGTCILSGGSSYGIKVCDCVSKSIYNCKCPRSYSDSDATWGWDSYHEQYFYGHTGYFFSVYNKNLKLDLPVYLRIVQAKRNDAVSAIVALSEVKYIYPSFSLTSFIGDAIHDNYPTYNLLKSWNMSAIIPMKKTNDNNNIYPIPINKNGTPVCKSGSSMTHDGPCKGRSRIKWRCPLATGKIDECSFKNECSPSDYGRVFYTKPDDDLRLFTSPPRESIKFKTLMKSRTTSERVNKRILNDYHLEEHNARGKMRISWWTMIHSINIHLDAQIKHSSLNFISILASFNSNIA